MARGSVIRYEGARGTVWRIKYVDASGKQVMETVGSERDGFTEQRALDELERRRVEVRDGFRKPEARAFRQTAQEWHAAERVARGWKPVTATKYRQSAEHLAAHFRGPLEALRSAERVDAYRDEALAAGLAPATVSRHLTVLNLILAWAVRKGLLGSRPTIAYPKVRQRKGVVLTPAQVQLLARSFDDEQARTAFLVFVILKLRRFELQRMRWRDVDLVELRLRIPDSKTETGARSLAIPPGLAVVLTDHLGRSPFRGADELVFCHPGLGSTYRYDRYRPALERAFAKAGLEWPEGFRACHDLRVSGSTNAILAGTHPAQLQQELGHSDYRTTQRYVNLAGTVFTDEAAALERRMLGAPVEDSVENSG
jgi:integrase/recombinase XerD